MSTFLRPYPPQGKASLSPRAAHQAERGFGDFPPARRGRSAVRLRLVQRMKVTGKEAYLIGKRAEHEQHLEFYIARYRGDAAEHDEYADRRQILWPKGLQMRVTLDPGVDHIKCFGEGCKAEEPAPAGQKVVLVPGIFL